MHKIKNNFHTHCQRCRHALGQEEDYVKSALSSGLSQLGFSDHAPYLEPEADFGRRMEFHELNDYLETVDTLTERYKDKIKIRKGLEIEYLPKYLSYYEELLTKWNVEYLLLGEHFYINAKGDYGNTYEIASTDEYIFYARTVTEGMKTGFFKAVAHPDLYLLNPYAWNDDCQKAADMIIDTAVNTGTILEYNANGFRRGLQFYPDGTRYPYPDDRFWLLAAKAPVKVIVSSDCHEPKYVWDDAMELAYEKLQALGICPIFDLGI